MDSPAAPATYVLVDGENLDATLGISVLGRRPAPDERPRWERLAQFAERTFGGPVRGLFFINASSGQLPSGFIGALLQLGFTPIPLSGPPTTKVVDVGIQRTLDALVGRAGNVVLGSHDGDFRPHVERLLDGTRSVGVVGFRELLNAGYEPLRSSGLQVFDLEDDVKAFNHVLPRVRIIDIDAFDPTRFL